ncbi:MAG: DUF948 domain-containing protein [Desulfuromonadales bacterium]|nr:DUF948 domain-containing protein [Desulfuromonadales bacterium]MDZ4185090.1 DUF948 domain-containing protein [Desulfuromonadales bacterium]
MPYTSLALIAVIAFIVLVGYVVWAMLQLRRTLQRVDEMIVNTERELTPLLANLRESTERMNNSIVHLEKGFTRAGGLFEAIGEVGDSVHNVNEFLRGGTRQYLNQGMVLWSGFQAFRNYFKRSHELKGE